MKDYKNFIQTFNQHFYETVFSKYVSKKTDLNELKEILNQSYYDFCYRNIEYKNLRNNDQVLQFIIYENLGLGAIDILFKNPNISEIMINGPDCIYYEINGTLHHSPLFFSSEERLRNIINKIASKANRRLDQSSPMLDTRLPDGSRLNAIIHPLVLNGTTVTIRRFMHKKISMQSLINSQSISQQAAHFLKFCVEHKKNILVSGGTGSGKTTLLNILSEYIPNSERIISIEDSAELKLKQDHVIRLETRTKNTESRGEISIRDLVKNSLRMRPDRIIVGECRSEEVMDMLQAMNTGHNGSMTTIHANSPRDALKRIENLVLLSGYNYPSLALREQIASSIDLIVSVQRDAKGRRSINNISEVSHIESSTVSLLELFKTNKDKLEWTKHYPNFLHRSNQNEQKLLYKIFKPQSSTGNQ